MCIKHSTGRMVDADPGDRLGDHDLVTHRDQRDPDAGLFSHQPCPGPRGVGDYGSVNLALASCDAAHLSASDPNGDHRIIWDHRDSQPGGGSSVPEWELTGFLNIKIRRCKRNSPYARRIRVRHETAKLLRR